MDAPTRRGKIERARERGRIGAESQLAGQKHDGDGHGYSNDDVQIKPAADWTRNGLLVDRDKRHTGPERGGCQCFDSSETRTGSIFPIP